MVPMAVRLAKINIPLPMELYFDVTDEESLGSCINGRLAEARRFCWILDTL